EPPTLVVMIGSRCAIASMMLFDVPSANDGNTNTSRVRMNALQPAAPSYEPTNSQDPFTRNWRTRALSSCTAGPVPANRTSTPWRFFFNRATASANTNGPLPVSIRAAYPKIVSTLPVVERLTGECISQSCVSSGNTETDDKKEKRWDHCCASVGESAATSEHNGKTFSSRW